MAEEKEQTKYRRSNGTTTSTKKLKTYKKITHRNINCFDFTCELDCLYYSELSKWN